MDDITAIIKSKPQEAEVQVCQYCRKAFIKRDFPVTNLNIFFTHYVPACDCIAKNEEKEKLKEVQALKAKSLKRKFENSMISPFFQEKRFENLTDAEHVAFCKDYACGFKPREINGILMIGDVGTGKSTLQACICNVLIECGFNCLFTTLAGLLERFTEAMDFENKETVSGLLKWLCRYDYVVLDDIGREKYTDSKLSLAFRIIDELMNNKTTVSVTANPENIYKLSEIKDFKAILDRLYHLCPNKLEFHGESFRRKK